MNDDMLEWLEHRCGARRVPLSEPQAWTYHIEFEIESPEDEGLPSLREAILRAMAKERGLGE